MTQAIFSNLVQGAYVPNATGDLYTVGTGQRVRIDRFSVTNQTSSAVTVTLRVLPAGASDANEHRIYVAYSIPGDGKPVLLPAMLRTLKSGDRIRGSASSSNAISVFMDGVIFK